MFDLLHSSIKLLCTVACNTIGAWIAMIYYCKNWRCSVGKLGLVLLIGRNINFITDKIPCAFSVPLLDAIVYMDFTHLTTALNNHSWDLCERKTQSQVCYYRNKRHSHMYRNKSHVTETACSIITKTAPIMKAEVFISSVSLRQD